MKKFRILISAMILVAGASVTQASFVPYSQPKSWFESHVNLAEPEQARIQKHLALVETRLRAHPPAGLTAAQRRNRMARIRDLHAYRLRGEFPRNLDFPDRLIPYFIDAQGVPCAMGYLVIQSGGKDFAAEVHRKMNNAYIGEIAAADPRLAAWTRANGMTLEEAAMVQPGYGPPKLSAMTQIRLDSLSRPWAIGPDANSLGPGVLFYLDSLKWKLNSNSIVANARFCLTEDGKPLIVEPSGSVKWNGKLYGPVPRACEWARHDSDAWVAGNQGLSRLRRSGASDTLVRTDFKTALASDTVTGVAVTTNAVWGATARGLYRRGLVGADTGVTLWDSTTLGGNRVTGLKAMGNRVWAGTEGATNQFSTRGLQYYNGYSWRPSPWRTTLNSIFVPSDTIYALAIRDTGTVWVAVRSGFYRFPVLSGTSNGKVADIPSGVTVNDLVSTSTGFYAGTSNGLYEFRNDSLVSVGVPVPIRRDGISRSGNGTGARPKLQMLTAAEARRMEGARSVTGQKTGPQAAAGVYLVSPVKTPE